MELPHFRYHPYPLRTGSIKKSGNTCVVCGQARGYIYSGPVYARKEYIDCICPWCIADGTAHERLAAEFTDAAFVGGGGRWIPVSREVIEEVTFRTPGFDSWQGEKWFTHCDNAAAFLGAVGYEELKKAGPEAIEAIRQDTGLSGDRWKEHLHALDKDGSPTAYLFQCLHCGEYGGYQDCD
jgi:uncharacterized protein CbrC (UPF0167 family)